MKKSIIILPALLLLLACGDKPDSVEGVLAAGDQAAMKAKKTELVNEQNALKEDIDKLTVEIEKKGEKKRAALVTTRTLKDTVFKHYIDVQGNVETDENIILYPEFSGVLTRIYVKEGQQVRKGQQLARIDDGGLGSELARQEAQTALAKTTFERQKRLWDQKIGSEMSFLEAKTNFEASQAATNQLKSRVGKSVMTASFSGVIDNIIAEQGQVVNQGQTEVMRLINLDNMYVNASVPESFLGKVNQGTEVIIALGSLGRELEGKVYQVGNYIDPDNRTFDVKVAIPNADSAIKPNLIATVKVNDYTAQNAIAIPSNVIQQNAAGNSIAYIYTPKTDSTGVAKQVKLEKGLDYGNQVEIAQGLEAGEQLIIEGARSLRDGQEVAAKNPKAQNNN